MHNALKVKMSKSAKKPAPVRVNEWPMGFAIPSNEQNYDKKASLPKGFKLK